MRSEDGQIIRECLDGDSASFGLLVDKYKASIYALAYSRLHNFHDAEDIAQETFLKAYKNLNTLRRWDSFLVWIRSIAINLCKNKIRTQARRPDSEPMDDQEKLEKASADLYGDEQSSVAHQEALDSLNRALESLPETYQQVLTLHYLGKMSGQQISQFLGISHSSVRQRLSRARKQLREDMIAMMSSAYEQQRLQAGFTFRIVETVKHIKINPMPRMAGIPLGLSLAMGIIITVMSLNPNISVSRDMAIPAGSPLRIEANVLKTGEIPVEILKTSEILVVSNKQGDGEDGEPEPPALQNKAFMAPRGEADTWTARADMPTGRAYPSACAVNGKIYVIGGTDAVGKQLPTVEEYNPKTDKWKQKADMPTPRVAFSVAVVNGKIYAIGGSIGGGSTVEEYDPIADTWTKKADMPTRRGTLVTAVVKDKIYAIGGWGGVNFSAVEEYDPATDTWTKKADMPIATDAMAFGVVNDKIYVFGGWLNGVGHLPDVREYDPATDTWMDKADMQATRYYASAVTVDGKIYVVGGLRWGAVTPDVDMYDPVTDTWKKKASMPERRITLGSVSALNGKIYVTGGLNVGVLVGQAAPVLSSVVEYDTGFVVDEEGKNVEAKGKLPTKWGEIKSD